MRIGYWMTSIATWEGDIVLSLPERKKELGLHSVSKIDHILIVLFSYYTLTYVVL